MEVKEVSNNNSQQSDVVSEMFTMGHEKVLICQDPKSGLKAIIAVHSTVCGPSLGGTRMWSYKSESDALRDVLRLSRGMTYKNAISNLNLGGGKAVIIGDSRKDKSEALFRSFGRYVESLAGSYITAEDVGISPEDMLHISKETKHVSGMPGKSGDPSPVTAFGVYMGMKAAAKIQFGDDNLNGKKIAIQGVGHVGEYLVGYLAKEGADITVTDIHKNTLNKVANKYSCKVVSPEDIYKVDMDIFAPCALGSTVNDLTLKELNCSIIAGAANNQLADEDVHGNLLMEKGIIYAPDFLINAGGVMNCYAEVMNISSEEVMKMAENIYSTTYDIIQASKKEGLPTFLVANRMAEQRIQKKLATKQNS